MTDAPGAPQVAIETLALSLPAGFEGRAARIGRLTAEALAAAPPMARAAHIERLALAPQAVAAHWSDARIADALAEAIRRGLDAAGE